MLANCQANLHRWEMDANLFRGNAERLPFDDASFDVVFHAGGINFFSDRAKAIREMIRVAKPGHPHPHRRRNREHVKGAYERFPITSRFFKNRKEAVAAPVDLVPSEMLEVRLDTVWNNRFYALTFRKPRPGELGLCYSNRSREPASAVHLRAAILPIWGRGAASAARITRALAGRCGNQW